MKDNTDGEATKTQYRIARQKKAIVMDWEHPSSNDVWIETKSGKQFVITPRGRIDPV